MATILSVHGTFATGPDAGADWWQKGSPAQKTLAGLVEAAEGELHQEPVRWDGANSEQSRRNAGEALYARMQALAAKGEPFAVIGHSHGGSVISAALMEAGKRADPLASLKAWITVGTPFVQTKRGPTLFNRLGVLGRSAYVALLTIFLALLMLFLRKETLGELCPAGSMSFACGTAFGAALLAFVVPFVVFYLLSVYLERKRLHLYRPKVTNFSAAQFRARWLPLWHQNDEAIQGLKSIGKVRLAVFSPAFAVKPLSAISIVLLPLVLFALVTSAPTMNALHGQAKSWGLKPSPENTGPDGRLIGGGHNIAVNNQLLLEFIGSMVVQPLEKFTRAGNNGQQPFWFNLIGLFSLSAVALAVALVFTLAFNLVCRVASLLLARLLNPLTMGQVRAQAFGSDTVEDWAVEVLEGPMWLGTGRPPLPEPLGGELQAASDTAMAKALPKFRAAPRLFASAAKSEHSDIFAEYLTWDELIHTAYFRNERFLKLLAFALSEAPGFRASETFKRDPDYATVAALHRQITAAGAGNK